MPVVTRVSQATLPLGSCSSTASRTASEIWSAILSGCPSVTDSDVNMCRCRSDIVYRFSLHKSGYEEEAQKRYSCPVYRSAYVSAINPKYSKYSWDRGGCVICFPP